MILALILAAVVALPPLKPVQSVNLSGSGSAASDVAWLNADELLVALVKGGVVKVSLGTARVAAWLPQGQIPDGIPYAELVATDGDLVAVVGGGKNYVFRKSDGTHVAGGSGEALNPRGVAVVGDRAYFIGWISRVGTDEDQQRGVLWSQVPTGKLSNRPLHRIMTGAEALGRWRLTMHPYGGSIVALRDGSIAIINSAEPGIYRYDAKGKLVEVLGSGIESLIVDSPRLAKSYARDIVGRYREFLDRQPSIDDLVATPSGLAILVRVATEETIQWQLWYPGRTDASRMQAVEPKVNGPIGHMKCEARGARMACVTNMPTAEQARQPGTAGSNPTLFIYRLER